MDTLPSLNDHIDHGMHAVSLFLFIQIYLPFFYLRCLFT